MSRSIVVKSFAELAEALTFDNLEAEGDDESVERLLIPSEPSEDGVVLADLLRELEAASLTLATVVRQDQESRTLALRDLDHYDALVAREHEATQVVERARRTRREAETLIGGAFAEEARAAARHIAEVAARAEEAASRATTTWRQEAERLAVGLDLDRLLAERRRQEEAEKERAAAAQRAERLSGAHARALMALEAGRFAEARGMLDSVLSENPNNPEITSLREMIAQRERVVKDAAAEEALWAARRDYRRDPVGVVAFLSAIDVDGLPDSLARQIFGEWARACSRLCRDKGIAEPLRYAPDPGRGAVLAREDVGKRY